MPSAVSMDSAGALVPAEHVADRAACCQASAPTAIFVAG
jgi:hypothetical protein